MPKQVVSTSDKIPGPVGPYSVAVTANPGDRVLHISGQVALDSDGQLVGEGDIRTQATQTFANIRAILEEAGGSIDDLAKITIFLKDIRDLPIVSEVRRAFYGGAALPATTTVQASLVDDSWLIEVEATAHLAA